MPLARPLVCAPGYPLSRKNRQSEQRPVSALDIGSVRIGVATSDESEFLASPYTTIRRRSDQSGP